MTQPAQIIQFPKKGKKTTTINLEVQTEILEDGSVWMRTKLNIDKEWGEWERVSLS
jgi:hypothetical protein